MFTYVFLNASRGNIFKRFEGPSTIAFSVDYSCAATYLASNLVAVNSDGDTLVIGVAESSEDMFDSVANVLYWYDKHNGITDKSFLDGFKEYFDRVRACEEVETDNFYKGFVERHPS